MTIATVQFMSNALWREVTYTALIPDEAAAGPGPYPVLYQLHGGNQSHTSWLYSSQLREYIRDMPFIVILPDGAQTRWANGGPPFTAYETFLVEELAQHVRHTFPATAGKWAIGGNSMGGGAAVRLGLRYPHQFFSVWSHSGGFPSATTLAEHWYWAGTPEALDCYALADQLDPSTLPVISFDCGTEDHLLEGNRHFHAHLESRRIPHTYKEYPGQHNWAYWNAHLPEALQQHFKLFKRL